MTFTEKYIFEYTAKNKYKMNVFINAFCVTQLRLQFHFLQIYMLSDDKV